MKTCKICFQKVYPINGVLYHCKNKDCERDEVAVVKLEEENDPKTRTP